MTESGFDRVLWELANKEAKKKGYKECRACGSRVHPANQAKVDEKNLREIEVESEREGEGKQE